MCISFSPAEGGKNRLIGSPNCEKLVNDVEVWLREEVGNSSASTLPISSGGSISILELFEIFQKSGLLFSELKFWVRALCGEKVSDFPQSILEKRH